jgi:hypothetical protein
MQPFDEASHCSAKPVRLVLEMRQGWFAKRGIKPGFKLPGHHSSPDQARASGSRRNKGRTAMPSGPCHGAPGAQAKLAAAKSQFTSLSRKVSTNFGRRLR